MNPVSTQSAGRWPPAKVPQSTDCSRGLTLLEVMITLAIISILSGIGAQVYKEALYKARVGRATADVRTIERTLSTREIDGALPATLADIGWQQVDPWGREYQYNNFAVTDPEKLSKDDGKPKNARRDKFLKPLNSTYDLYSTGQDGEWKPSLKEKTSADDVLRAADGIFVGLATDF